MSPLFHRRGFRYDHFGREGSSVIGFVILSHNNPGQVRRLIRTLNALYDSPPIACHHDFGQSSLSVEGLGPHVHLVDASVATGWGKWSLVVGYLRALRLLYRHANPDWSVLLSGADYPVRAADEVARVLQSASVDAFLDLSPLGGERNPPRHTGDPDPRLLHYKKKDVNTRRHLQARITLPIGSIAAPRDELTDIPDFATVPRRSIRVPFSSPLSPFKRGWTCYVGSQWFTANRKAADVFLHPTPGQIRLRKYYSRRWVPDESFVHTVLGNDPSISIDRDPRRFAIWDLDGWHPRTLGLNELPEMQKSGAHFARKFAPDGEVLDALDRQLGVSQGG